MDVTSQLDRTGTEDLDPGTVLGKIEFTDVEFAYEKDAPVFSKFNLTVQPGETVALVGHTGAGKSSVVSLLGRFYELGNGEILLDGKDIREYDLNSYRSVIGIVLQDPLLFSGTLRSNIAYGLPDASDELILKAAEYANLLDFINAQPEGLDTQIEERGRKLSQGQRQLISLARAFLVNPRILLLDEATASIDAYSEALIQESIDTILYDRTSIVIAHRLTTIQRVDRIVVLEKGEVIEQGTHKELLQHGGQYATLYQKYFAFQEIQD
jgi:ABC-type multidrug transport system fused ATPase/permease subunit